MATIQEELILDNDNEEQAETLDTQEEQEDIEIDSFKDGKLIHQDFRKIDADIDYIKEPAIELQKTDIDYNNNLWLQAIYRTVATITHSTEEQIQELKTRTKTQQQMIDDLTEKYINTYKESRYLYARKQLEPLTGKFFIKSLLEPEYNRVKDHAIIYFFSIHKEIKLDEAGELTVKQIEELKNLYHKIDDYYYDNQEELKEYFQFSVASLIFFAEQKNIPLTQEVAKDIINTERTFSVKSKTPLAVQYPFDKVSSSVFGLTFNSTPNDGKLKSIKAESSTDKRKIDIYFSIDFSELKETFPNAKAIDKLTAYDKRVYIALEALRYAGNEYVSIRQIYNAMGHTNRKKGSGATTDDRKPNSEDRKKILTSLRKFLAPIVLDNFKEKEADYHYPHFKYTGVLFPLEFVECDTQICINGIPTRDAIHILQEAPLMKFARSRNQFTTITPELLDTPYSMTDENIAIDDYLLRRIKRERNTPQITILLSTLYENVGIISRCQKSRAPEKIEKHLAHFKSCNLISRYRIDKTEGKIFVYTKNKH